MTKTKKKLNKKLKKKLKKMRRQANKINVLNAVALAAIGGLLAACSGTKNLGAGEYLYTGAEIDFVSEDNIPNKGQLKNDLEGLVRPEPNGSLFGMRPRVWIYNATRDSTPDKGFGSWLNRTIGEPPVLLSQVDPGSSRNLIQNRLFNSGFFRAEVDYEIVQNKNTAHINFSAYLERPYRIDSVVYPQDGDTLRRAIASMKDESLLKVGAPYNVENLTEERERLSRELKDLGFYYFAPDYLIFEVDTALGDKELIIWLDVKEATPQEALTQYRLENIVVDPNYSFMLDTIQSRRDTVNVNDYSYVLSSRDLKPSVVTDAIFLQPDSIYSRTAHEQTLNRLMGLGVFQYANVRFEDSPSRRGLLNAIVQATPVKKKSIRMELQGVSTSYYVGPNANVSFQNRNFFGGAELFDVNFNAGLEFNTGRRQSALNAYTFGAETNIYFPRFVVPFFNIRNESSYYVPRTRLRLGYQRTNRIDLFRLNSFNVAAGYLWQETRSKRHELYPMDIDFLQLTDTSAQFHRMLRENEFLSRSYEEQFILSSRYSFTFNNQHLRERRHNFFFNGAVDVSGNLMHLIQSGFKDREATPEDPYNIFGFPYSQYSKVSTDFRHYFSIDQNHKIASRLFIGVGMPYGNSNTMPFVKQFFVGGTNSVRAFAARSIGPGTFVPEDLEGLNRFYEQLGDMKIEANLEYRFPIYSIFKGALFVDVGNVWLIENNDQRKVFDFDTFLDQLAVGTGFGIRLDVDFFVLRFDFGVPLRLPQGWVWKDLDVRPEADKDWNDITFNIGIGYPF